jgi:uncharacterized cupin superfamily protein
MRKVRAELGLTSFGVQTIDMPPSSDRHPWHDHGRDGQEELYVALQGGGTLEVEGVEPVELAPGETLARVGPALGAESPSSGRPIRQTTGERSRRTSRARV